MSVATLDSALDANLVEFATVLTGDEDQSHLEPYTRAWGEAEYAIFADHENDIVDALWLDVAEAVFLDVDAMAMVIETIPRVDELLLIDWSYLHFFPLSRRDQLREYLLFLRWNAILMRALSNPSLALMQWTPDALAFGHEVIATGSVWALRDMRGLLLPSDPTGQRYLQLWSTPERLTETIKRARGYDSYVVVEIGKQALCELILPQLEEERIPIVANWDGYGSGGLSLTVDAKRWKPRIPASDLGPEYN